LKNTSRSIAGRSFSSTTWVIRTSGTSPWAEAN
jgi:hypothetical protein